MEVTMAFLSNSFPKKEVISVSPEKTVTEAAYIMLKAKVGSVLVLDNNKIVGIFTERDLLNAVIAKDLDPKKTKIAKVMTPNVCTIDIQETIEACYQKMNETKCRRMPILDKNQVIGMITMRDILRRKMEEVDFENKQLKDYIYT